VRVVVGTSLLYSKELYSGTSVQGYKLRRMSMYVDGVSRLSEIELCY
jgi:hypothetical protein